MHQISIYLLALYFIFEGLNNLFDNYRRAESFDNKLYNLQAYLYNRQLLIFEFYEKMRSLTNTFLLIYGLAILIGGSAIAFFDEKHIRNNVLKLLIAAEIFESLIIHNPFIENQEGRHNELHWLVKNLAIVVCLVLAMRLK